MAFTTVRRTHRGHARHTCQGHRRCLLGCLKSRFKVKIRLKVQSVRESSAEAYRAPYKVRFFISRVTGSIAAVQKKPIGSPANERRVLAVNSVIRFVIHTQISERVSLCGDNIITQLNMILQAAVSALLPW